MRSSLLLSAAVIGLSSSVALAQNAVGTAQTPPSAGASSQAPQPANSVPYGATTSAMPTPGSNVGTTGAPTQPMPHAMPRARTGYAPAGRSGMTHGAYGHGAAAHGAEDQSAPPTGAYRGGAGSPFSDRASNTTSANTHSEIAPRLPSPDAAANSPEALLSAAQQALRQGRTGAAQQALEMAETRVLSRTVDPTMANQPDQAMMVKHIGDARRALGARNRQAAEAAIAAAMSAPVPPPGPTVTTTYPGQPGMAPAGMMPPRN